MSQMKSEGCQLPKKSETESRLSIYSVVERITKRKEDIYGRRIL